MILKNKKMRSYLINLAIVFLLLNFFYPQHLKRLIYPYLFGKKTNIELQISQKDYFNDVDPVPFSLKKNGQYYLLEPKTAYAVTGRVGIVEHYDTLFYKFFRGQFQGDYMNLVPRDIFLVIGQMANEDVFKKFKFHHEERMGQVLCKDVKYRTSFLSAFISKDEAKENMKKYHECVPYIKEDEQNNYHPIPATEKINKALSMLLPSDIVYMEGYLVDVPQMGLKTGTRKSQHHENMIMNGYNPGMCFILYTTKVILNGYVYE